MAELKFTTSIKPLFREKDPRDPTFDLSSRAERSAVEGSAVAFADNRQRATDNCLWSS